MNYIFQNIYITGGDAIIKVLQESFVHQTYMPSVTLAVEMTAREGNGYNQALKMLPVDDDKELYIVGFYHGFHTLLRGRSRYIAVFRNPLDRAIAFANVLFNAGYISSFGSWLRAGAFHEIDNYLTRACVQEGIHRRCNDALLMEAKSNLLNNYIVGTGDALPDVIDRINRVTGKQMKFDQKVGFPKQDIVVPITEGDKQHFKAVNHWDYRLYEFAKGLGELQSGRGNDAEVFHGKET